MKPDKDKPWTWIKYRKGMCEGCAGNCCTMPVEIHAEDLVRLGIATEDEVASNDQGGSRKKLAKRLIKEGLLQSYRETTELFMLTQRPNGDCYYLHPVTRLCTVYEKRPSTCRRFPEIGPRPGFCPSNRKNAL
jgi:Fe-S-cluster containining protein